MTDDAPKPHSASGPAPKPRRSLSYHTATVRNAIVTKLPDLLLGGRLRARHVAQPIELNEYTLSSANWPRAFDGVRIAHLSDIHFGHLLGPERLVQAVDAVRAVKPDLIAITGDRFSSSTSRSSRRISACSSCSETTTTSTTRARSCAARATPASSR